MEMTWNIIAFFHVQLNLFMALHGVWKSAKKVALLNYWMTLRKKLFHDNLLMRLKSFLKHSSHSYKNETFLWDFQTLWSSLFLRAINHARWVSMRSACILMVSKKLVMVQKDQQRFNFQFASKASYINTGCQLYSHGVWRGVPGLGSKWYLMGITNVLGLQKCVCQGCTQLSCWVSKIAQNYAIFRLNQQ